MFAARTTRSTLRSLPTSIRRTMAHQAHEVVIVAEASIARVRSLLQASVPCKAYDRGYPRRTRCVPSRARS
ncbi:hypothetical protein PsYK624_170980 [Phanerochaete sordida]|uniref:Uncharacterized protein n=1 Tax=Phanerochaete sordida TaxID=48140 RepID=A0A9P3LMQ3_9APHY|nr:hypothetical protein PsYK624_170980 [Phanerochaete sordida]